MHQVEHDVLQLYAREIPQKVVFLKIFLNWFKCTNCTGSADSNWCISDEHFFMIQWHFNRKSRILGSWDSEIWYKTFSFYFINFTWPPWPQKLKVHCFLWEVGKYGASIILTPLPFLRLKKSWVLGLSYGAYIFSVCTMIGSFRIFQNLEKGWSFLLCQFVFVFIPVLYTVGL
jgi:hypothetical protein